MNSYVCLPIFILKIVSCPKFLINGGNSWVRIRQNRLKLPIFVQNFKEQIIENKGAFILNLHPVFLIKLFFIPIFFCSRIINFNK